MAGKLYLVMKKLYLLLLAPFLLLRPYSGFSQFYSQNLDGGDTLVYSPEIAIDPASDNTWIIGTPAKSIFSAAYSSPNGIVTNLKRPYPSDNRSVFELNFMGTYSSSSIYAVQWMQKLDMTQGEDGALIEIASAPDYEYENIFTSEDVAAVFGYDPVNLDTLSTGEIVFSGQDTAWKNVWLCMWFSVMSRGDTAKVRFTFISDSNPEQKEGWLMDDFAAQVAVPHTLNMLKARQFVQVYPSPADEVLTLELLDKARFSQFDEIRLFDVRGIQVGVWENVPGKFTLPTDKFPTGSYYFRIRLEDNELVFYQRISHP